MSKAKKAEKVVETPTVETPTVETPTVKTPTVKRLPSLSLTHLYKMFRVEQDKGGSYASLAESLGRPLMSVQQRVTILRKRLREEHSVELGTLASNGRGRTKEDLSDIAADQRTALENMG